MVSKCSMEKINSHNKGDRVMATTKTAQEVSEAVSFLAGILGTRHKDTASDLSFSHVRYPVSVLRPTSGNP